MDYYLKLLRFVSFIHSGFSYCQFLLLLTTRCQLIISAVWFWESANNHSSLKLYFLLIFHSSSPTALFPRFHLYAVAAFEWDVVNGSMGTQLHSSTSNDIMRCIMCYKQIIILVYDRLLVLLWPRVVISVVLMGNISWGNWKIWSLSFEWSVENALRKRGLCWFCEVVTSIHWG